ncbi:MAG: membrane protein insertion efficiency factor YidD [Luminiphilus sp.]|nr:membrane protein insertion efficiency factor YidD [Luminiphilus sp.]MDG2036695.1 membrane protein insertion efficiency factor YidD [Luminiphilus sp.]RZO80488.1 MAG: membrane protein insertion efficiency factor YidD [Halieaceae bacterium]
MQCIKWVDRRIATGLALFIRGYQLTLSPWLGRSCRFTPTCSQYGIDALQAHGAVTGVWLTARRLLRCHPWCAGGYDPVPPQKSPHHTH